MKSRCLFMITLLLSLFSCSSHEKKDLDAIPINLNEFVNEVKSGEEWIESIKFIPLETSGTHFVPDDATTKAMGSYWLLANLKQMLVFDREGNFLSEIKAQGGGPQEYRAIYDFDLLPDKNEIVLCDNHKLTFFSPDGTFIGKTPIPLRSQNVAALGDGYFALAPGRFYKGRDESAGKYQLFIVDRNGEIIDRKFKFAQYIINASEVTFRRSPDGKSHLFSLGYDWNIYEIGPGPVVHRKYTFDYGPVFPDTSLLQDESVQQNDHLYLAMAGKVTQPNGVKETSSALIINAGSDKLRKWAIRLIDPESGLQKTVVMNKPPELGTFNGWPIYPPVDAIGAYLFHLSPAYLVLEQLESLTPEHKAKLSNYPGFKHLTNLTPEDNPVIIMYKISLWSLVFSL